MASVPPLVQPPPDRPVVLYDGECAFCCHWAGRWREKWGARLEIVPGQDSRQRFPQISDADLTGALQLIETDGRVFSGVEAVMRARALGRGRESWTMHLYRRAPLVRFGLDGGYRLVARHRRLLSWFLR